MHGHSAPQITSDFLVNAWLDAHFIHPLERNPLTSGFFIPRPIPPHQSSPVSDTTSDPLSQCQSSDRCERPPKRPRLVSNAVDHVQHYGQELRETAGGGGCQSSGGIAATLNPSAWNADVSRTMPNNPTFPITESWGGGGAGGGENAGNAQSFMIPKGNRGGDEGQGGVDDANTHASFAASLNTSTFSISAPRKRKSDSRSKSSSPSKISASFSDTRRKRLALRLDDPAGTFGIPDLADYDTEHDVQASLPSHVIAILQRFSPGNFELACIPQTAEIDVLLTKYFPHERIPPHARLEVFSEDDESLRALNLVRFAMEIHRQCLRNSREAEDEAAWYPPVRALLSIDLPPPSSSSKIAVPPRSLYTYHPTVNDLFLTIDATTKSTSSNIPPTDANVKLDALVAFNPQNQVCSTTTLNALRSSIKLNAFTNPGLDATIIILGIEVKPSGGTGGEMEAEYQLGAWGMKTLNLTKALSQSSRDTSLNCHTALSLSICGHVWSLHVSYWRSEEIVTHGPIVVGTTDSLYGTLKIVAFVKAVKEWAMDELWSDWKRLLEGVMRL